MLSKVACDRCGRGASSADRYCASCGDPLPQALNAYNISLETTTGDSSPLGKELDRIEHLALLFAGVAERFVHALKDGEPDSQRDSNREKSKNGKHGNRGRGEPIVIMFTVGAISLVLIATIIATGVWGLSARTAVPLAALLIIFALAAWLVLCGRR